MKRTGLWLVVPAVIIVIGGCSRSERTQTQEQPAGRPAAVGTGGAGGDLKSDAEFVHDMALMNMAEVELSRMALSMTTSPDVKSFAQQMIDEHNEAASKLKSAVSGGSIGWPGQLDDKRKETADELARKQGPDFDREYAKAMVEGHQDFAALLESRLDVQSLADWKTAAASRTRGNTLPDPKTEMRDVVVRPLKSDNEATMKINQWAADTFPVAQQHLDAARTLENATKKRSTN
jgi:putative membrane protein